MTTGVHSYVRTWLLRCILLGLALGGVARPLFAEAIEIAATPLLDQARASLEAGKLDDAIQQFTSVREKFPGGQADQQASYMLAFVAARKRDLATARQEAVNLLQRFPASSLYFDTTYLLAAIELGDQKFAKAYSVVTGLDLNAHRPADPKRIAAFYDLAAQAAVGMNNHPVAVAIAAFQLAMAPDEATRTTLWQSLDGYLAKIDSEADLQKLVKDIQDPQISQRIKDRILALRGNAAAAAVDPAAAALIAQGRQAAASGRYDEAVKVFQQVREAYHGGRADRVASYSLGIVHCYRKDYANAAKELEAYLARFPSGEDIFEVSYLWASVEYELQHYERTYRLISGFDFLKVPKQNPARIQAFYDLAAKASAAMGNYAAAVSVTMFQRTLPIDDKSKENLLEQLNTYLDKVNSSDDLGQLLGQTQDKQVTERIRNRIAAVNHTDRTPSVVEHGNIDATALPPRSGDLTLGVNYVFPTLTFQQGVGEQWSVGITSLLLNYPSSNGASLKGFGGLVTMNYYGESRFYGMWVQGGLGLFPLTATLGAQSESLTSIAGIATLGWRWYFPSGANLGFAAGVNFLARHSAPQLAVDFPSTMPALILDFGFGL